MKKLVFAVSVLIVSSGCVRHMYPYQPKQRDYNEGVYAARDAGRTPGSLYSDVSWGLFEEGQAAHVGDIVTIKVDETSNANRDASTDTSREDKTDLGFLSAMTSFATKHPGVDPTKLFSGGANQQFTSRGSTGRADQITAMLPARVKRQLPNGDLYIEGTKIILLNDEETHLYMSGVVRPVDIRQGNVVNSSVIADVELEITGRGVISERQSPNWLSRALDYLWPF